MCICHEIWVFIWASMQKKIFFKFQKRDFHFDIEINVKDPNEQIKF